jgi:hypothetical protein
VDEPLKTLNRLLCESKTKQAVVERIDCGPVVPLPIAESTGGQQLYRAKVFHTDKANQNQRIYTRAHMERVIEGLKPKMAAGGVNGSIDHGTGLATQAIIWREMSIDDSGAGYGNFAIVEDHSSGRDLKAQIASGMSVGFSTYGYGTAHQASEAEQVQYGCNEDCVVMNDDYELAKIDAVDDPSVPDARIEPKTMTGNGVPQVGADYAARNAKAAAEACSTGLHWIELGKCGHVIGQCRCESDKKHYVYSEKQCQKCQDASHDNRVDGAMTAEQFKAHWVESKKKNPVSESSTGRPLAKRYSQYIKDKSGDVFEPTKPITLADKLEAHAYKIVSTWEGVAFVRAVSETDELYQFPGSVMEAVLAEIDKFWGMKEDYAKFGVLFNRGIIMHGPPGTGKTSAAHQVVDMVTGQGDVVFYAKSIGVLGEALRAFRQVEPERKVVVVLEDADEYVGYQEREFLNLLDGAESISGILYLATTNYLERFPPRLLRPGRFDKRVLVGPPPIEGRQRYLEQKLAKVETPEEIARLAAATDGLSFGHLRELITAVYVLKEDKEAALNRLKGVRTTPPRASSNSTRLNVQTEGRDPEPKTIEVEPMSESNKKSPAVEAINAMLAKLSTAEGIDLPHREVLPAEVAERLTAAEKSVETSKVAVESLKGEHLKEIEKLQAEKAELQKLIDAAQAEKAQADRIGKVDAKAKLVLKDNAYAGVIDKLITKMAKSPEFTEASVEPFVAEKVAEYEAVKAATVQSGALSSGVDGSNVNDIDFEEQDDVGESADPSVKPAEPAPELYFGKKSKK